MCVRDRNPRRRTGPACVRDRNPCSVPSRHRSSGFYAVTVGNGDKPSVSGRPGKTWLFHFASDPTEQRNLADGAPVHLTARKPLVAERNAQQAPSLWQSAVVSPIDIDRTLLDPDAPDDSSSAG